ncbi:probable LRR receptor-like serine/threonine-protein kinase At4g31250 [Asparagus officinalis]|uniref:probable LRR receptor-like serine/threonine-protein kinase At4g31250 n=1 Tax=Asparagus officinalis TaxID=4686 RepID=UPI00098E53B3|nr:probable LRR receptor-like serine/threonine-protein kinase At4g31250 [Asparagus officinalis]
MYILPNNFWNINHINYEQFLFPVTGNRTAENPALDWPNRLKIIRGIARGLNYLYEEFSTLAAPHGHLKSSNVLLDDSYEPLLSDYALLPVTTNSFASQVLIAYKSPEYKQHGRISNKSDVWSLGVLILEILTGKYPGNYSRQARGGSDLANWVNSVVREEWTGEVFDGEMRRSRNGEGEMLKLLQIGLGCCEADVNKRWELRYALEKIEELKERDAEEDYSSVVSEGEGYSSRGGMTEDEFSFSTVNNA